MSWHIVCRAGDSDDFLPALALAALCSPADATRSLNELIPHGNTCRVADYPESTAGRPGCPVIGHPAGASDENPAGKWVALDPALARSLGWSLAADGMFRWLDDGGDLVAESVWWQDGPAGMGGHMPEDGQHPTSPGEVIERFTAVARHWNACPTPFVWGGKRAARRQRARERWHAVGGSGASTRSPIRRRYGHGRGK